jgi:hypothetical protein
MFHSFRDTSPGIKTDNAAGRIGNGGPGLDARFAVGPPSDAGASSSPQAPSYSALGKCLQETDQLVTKA